MNVRRITATAVWTCAGLLMAASAWAQEGHAEGGEQGGVLGALGIDPRTVLVQLFAFILLYLLFARFLWKPILGVLESRREEVSTIYTEAEQARQDADTARKEYEARIARADEESRERINAAISQAAAMKDEIIGTARDQADRIVTAGRESVRQEAEKAQVQMRDTAPRLAVDLAGRIIQREMDPNAHRALIDNFITSAGSDGKTGPADASGRAL